MTRLSRWPQRLNAYIAAAIGRPFSWGSHDCCTFADGAVEAVTGRRIMPEHEPYDTREGAVRALLACGYRSVEEALDQQLARALPIEAGRGDIAAVPSEIEGWPALGVVTGTTIHVLRPDGLAVLPWTAAQSAWRVG